MAIVRNFVYEMDDNGFEGLRPDWFGNATPTSGRGVAHDMMEHFSSQAGPVEGELEALGAALALRWEQGANRSLLSTEDIMAGDILSVILDMVREELQVPAPKRSQKIDDKLTDDTLVESVRRGFQMAKEEFRYDKEDAARSEALLTKELFYTTVSWLRRGYRRALKRYEAYDLYFVGNEFFSTVTKEIDRLISSSVMGYGDEVRISLQPGRNIIGLRVNGNCAYSWGYL